MERTIEITKRLDTDIKVICKNEGISEDKFISKVIKEKVDLLKYGDINDKITKLSLIKIENSDETLILHTTKGSIFLKKDELLSILGVKTEDVKQEMVVNDTPTDNEVVTPTENTQTTRKLKVIR